jgi:hypothetical protein
MERKDFKNLIDALLEILIKNACKLCPHKDDSHNINCFECCPVKITIEEKLSIEKDKHPWFGNAQAALIFCSERIENES